MKIMKKAIYLFLTSLVINCRKILIAKSEKKIGKLEVRLAVEKQIYKELLKENKTYCNKVLKTERNM